LLVFSFSFLVGAYIIPQQQSARFSLQQVNALEGSQIPFRRMLPNHAYENVGFMHSVFPVEQNYIGLGVRVSRDFFPEDEDYFYEVQLVFINGIVSHISELNNPFEIFSVGTVATYFRGYRRNMGFGLAGPDGVIMGHDRFLLVARFSSIFDSSAIEATFFIRVFRYLTSTNRQMYAMSTHFYHVQWLNDFILETPDPSPSPPLCDTSSPLDTPPDSSTPPDSTPADTDITSTPGVLPPIRNPNIPAGGTPIRTPLERFLIVTAGVAGGMLVMAVLVSLFSSLVIKKKRTKYGN